MKFTRLIGVAAASALLFAGSASAEPVKLRFATYITPRHSVSVWIDKMFKEIQAKSNGGIEVETFFGGQLGPPPKYYDLVTSGQVDAAWFLTGNYPGIFKLTEVTNLPFLIGSAEIGTKVLNDPSLQDKYLKKEYQGLKILNLHTHQPGDVFTARKPIRKIEDFKGMRIRFPSSPIKDLLVALGGTPTGIPPTDVVEAFQKGTLDGTFIDYGGAAFAFHMGPVTKYGTELYAYVGSFCICMNIDSYERLPAAMRKLIDDTFAAHAIEPGIEFDKLDVPAKGLMMKEGMQPIVMAPEEDRKIRTIAEKISLKHVENLQKQGLPAREVYDTVKALSAKYTPGSRNFWAR